MMPVSFLFSALQYSHTPSASLYEALKWKNPSCNISNRDMTNIGGNEVSFLDHSNFWKLFLACWLPIACWLQKCCSKLVHHIGKLFSSMKKHLLDFALAFIMNQNLIDLLMTCISLFIGSLHNWFWRCNFISVRGKGDLFELIQIVVKSKMGKLDFFCFIRKV